MWSESASGSDIDSRLNLWMSCIKICTLSICCCFESPVIFPWIVCLLLSILSAAFIYLLTNVFTANTVFMIVKHEHNCCNVHIDLQWGTWSYFELKLQNCPFSFYHLMHSFWTKLFHLQKKKNKETCHLVYKFWSFYWQDFYEFTRDCPLKLILWIPHTIK